MKALGSCQTFANKTFSRAALFSTRLSRHIQVKGVDKSCDENPSIPTRVGTTGCSSGAMNVVGSAGGGGVNSGY